jgi:flagellar assembly factor FliW
MPELETKCFGRVAYRPESVIEFPLGLPGFDNERRFLLIEQAINKPVVFLQSLSRPELCFLTVPVLGIVPDYLLSLSPEDLRTLDLAEDRQPLPGQDVLCLAVVSLSEDAPPTVNLLSPVIINWERRLAVQAVQADAPYSHRHPLLVGAVEAQC